MKIRLSNGMKRCILEHQEKALEIIPNLKRSEIHKIRVKPTKNKVFRFQISNMGYPILRIFINNKHYKDYFYKDKKWKEMKE